MIDALNIRNRLLVNFVHNLLFNADILVQQKSNVGQMDK